MVKNWRSQVYHAFKLAKTKEGSYTEKTMLRIRVSNLIIAIEVVTLRCAIFFTVHNLQHINKFI